MIAHQYEKHEGIFGGEFAEGSYTVTKEGFHVLDINHNSGYVWMEGQDDALEIAGIGDLNGFYVLTPEEIHHT